MRIQVLSDLHLETEECHLSPAPEAEVLVLAGDIDSSWNELARFKDWPVPVIFVAGNHEFDRREVTEALPELRAACDSMGFQLLECDSCLQSDDQGRRIRFLGTTRWSDFDLFGDKGRAKAQRAATYYAKVMRATVNGEPFNAAAVRTRALACREWLATALAEPGDWDATVVITHYAPSLLSTDPRYGAQPSSASFCNADDALLPAADLWIHGHVHCRHDYQVPHSKGSTRVICHARGFDTKGETVGYEPHRVVCVEGRSQPSPICVT